MLTVYRIQDYRGLGWSNSMRIRMALRKLTERVSSNLVWRHHDLATPMGDDKIRNIIDGWARQLPNIPKDSKKWEKTFHKINRGSYWYTYKSMAEVFHWFPDPVLNHLLSIRGIGLYKWIVPEHRCIVGDSQVMVLKRTRKIVERLHV